MSKSTLNFKIIGIVLALVLVAGIIYIGVAQPAQEQPIVDDPVTEEPIVEQPQEDPDDTREPVTLHFTFWGSPDEREAVKSAIMSFEEKHDWITVEAQHIPGGEYTTKITTMLAAGEEPDVAYLSEATALPWAEEGKLWNINLSLIHI